MFTKYKYCMIARLISYKIHNNNNNNIFIKNNILYKNNFIFIRNSDSVNIYKIIINKIIYINMKIELSFSVLLQLHIFYHDIDSVAIDFQMNYLRSFISSENIFFNIQVKNFI